MRLAAVLFWAAFVLIARCAPVNEQEFLGDSIRIQRLNELDDYPTAATLRPGQFVSMDVELDIPTSTLEQESYHLETLILFYTDSVEDGRSSIYPLEDYAARINLDPPVKARIVGSLLSWTIGFHWPHVSDETEYHVGFPVHLQNQTLIRISTKLHIKSAPYMLFVRTKTDTYSYQNQLGQSSPSSDRISQSVVNSKEFLTEQLADAIINRDRRQIMNLKKAGAKVNEFILDLAQSTDLIDLLNDPIVMPDNLHTFETAGPSRQKIDNSDDDTFNDENPSTHRYFVNSDLYSPLDLCIEFSKALANIIQTGDKNGFVNLLECWTDTILNRNDEREMDILERAGTISMGMFLKGLVDERNLVWTRALLEAGAKWSRDHFLAAINQKFWDIGRVFVEAGVKVKPKELEIAVINDAPAEFIRLLLDHGARISPKTKFIMEKVMDTDSKVFQILVEAAQNQNIQIESDLISKAIRENDLDTMMDLVSKSNFQMRPIHMKLAVRQGNVSLVNWMLKNGYWAGKAEVDEAVEQRNVEMLRLFQKFNVALVYRKSEVYEILTDDRQKDH